MPDGPEIETNELQEHAHHAAHGAHGDGSEPPNWVRTVSLSTAILAVFAAVGALQAGTLVNEAMICQIKSSDKWNEYQASREKSHLYTVGRNLLVDLGPASAKPETLPSLAKHEADFADQVAKEDTKAADLRKQAEELQKDGERMMKRHERFAYEVAMLQVAIALGAVSALTKVRWVWLLSMALGAVGIVLFAVGFMR